MPAIDHPVGFGVLQSFKRQVSPLAERQVVAESTGSVDVLQS